MKARACVFLGLCLCFLFAARLGAEEGAASRLPGVRTLGNISDQYTPVRFDHPKHVTIAGACSACHHQHADLKSLNCKDCHAITPRAFKNSVKSYFTACANCHGAYDRTNPSMPGLKAAYHRQCLQCHRGMGSVGLDPKGCAEMCHAKKQVKVGMKTGR